MSETIVIEVGTEATVVEVGSQGPIGPQGPSGGNIIVQPTAPSSPIEGDLWLNSSNQELSVYTSGVWEITTYKGELADDAGNLTLNAGYF